MQPVIPSDKDIVHFNVKVAPVCSDIHVASRLWGEGSMWGNRSTFLSFTID